MMWTRHGGGAMPSCCVCEPPDRATAIPLAACWRRRCRHAASPTRSTTPPSFKLGSTPGTSTFEKMKGIAADAATASGSGPLSMMTCRPSDVTTPTAKSRCRPSNVGGSNSRSRSTTPSRDRTPPRHGSKQGLRNSIGARSDRAVATCHGHSSGRGSRSSWRQ